MRRIKNPGLALVVALAASGFTAGVAAGKGGRDAPAEYHSLAPTTISSPQANIAFECQTFYGRGKTDYFRAGLKTCSVIGDSTCRATVHFQWIGKGRPESGVVKITVFKQTPLTFKVKKCSRAGKYEIIGEVYGEARGPEELEWTDPNSPLPSSDMTVNGKPAVWTGSYQQVNVK